MKQFQYDDQIAAQPAAIRELLAQDGAQPLDPKRPIVLTGEGTSLHACRVAATWIAQLSSGTIRPSAIDTHSLALTGALRADDQIVVVSHRGNKRFPNEVLQRARSVGAATVCVTGQGQEPIEADTVVRTCPQETAATHTVSYICALVALARMALPLAETDHASVFEQAIAELPDTLAATLTLPAPTAVAERLANQAPILCAGFDLDAVSADEAALKIKEGTYRWAEGMSLEQALHGPVAVYGEGTAAVIFEPAGDDGGRCSDLIRTAGEVGMDVIRCGPGEVELPYYDASPWIRPLTSIVPIQRVVAEMARLSGTNPDTIRTDEEPWASAIGRLRL